VTPQSVPLDVRLTDGFVERPSLLRCAVRAPLMWVRRKDIQALGAQPQGYTQFLLPRLGDHMSTPTVPARTETGQLNKLSMAAIFLAAIAASGLWLFGVGVLAVFAVGAGHVSLNQIKLRGERGRSLAIVALAMGYAIATLALFSTLSYFPPVVQQLSM